MLKNVFTVFILLSVVFSMSVLAAPKDLKVKVVTPEIDAKFDQKLNQIKYVGSEFEAVPEEVGRTFYDYSTNSIPGRQVAYANTGGNFGDGMHIIFMKRQPDENGNRYVTYDYRDIPGGFFFSNGSITETRATGWGRIANGPGDAVWGVMHGGGLAYFFDTGEADYGFTDVNFDGGQGGTFPGIDVAYDGTNVLVVVAGNIGALNTLAYSTDGTAFTNTGLSANFFDGASTTIGPAEVSVVINPTNWNEWKYVTDESDGVNSGKSIIWTTTDQGNTWSGQLAWDAADTNPNGGQWLIDNFGQQFGDYDGSGNYHIVANGYGAHSNGVSADFPVIYYNAAAGTWTDLTANDIAGHPADTDTALAGAMIATYPGNSIGNSYPQMSFGTGTNEIIAAWARPEIVDGVLQTGPQGFMATDIYYVYSGDGGNSWTDPAYLSGVANQSDMYVCLPKYFITDGAGNVTLDFIYLQDFVDGVSLFESIPGEAAWVYDRVELSVTGIEDFYDNVVDNFALAQNFPNPFNPSTNIAFALKQAADVSLEVFDVTGQKVATLVSGRQAAGDYNVVFDASNQASGVYFYKLTANNFTTTKKMVLMK
jgi:hypothetical protein